MSSMFLPSGWTLTTLDDLLAPLEDGRTLHHGWSPQCEKEPSRSDEEWGVLKTTAVQDGVFLPEHNKRLPNHLTPRPLLEARPGDILITCAGPRARCGVTCLVRHTRPRLMISGKMYRFRVPDSLMSASYAEASLRTPDARNAIDRMKTGISDSGLNLTHERFRKLSVLVAPLPEQHRIVETTESYFTRLDDAVATLERVQRNLKRHRASVLKAAVEGRLVPTEAELARGECRDFEPASALLGRILVERRRRWEASGHTGKYLEPAQPDTSDLPNLPEGWCWVSLSQLLAEPLVNGRSVPDARGGFPVLRLTALKADEIDLAERKAGRWSAGEAAAFLVNRGDFLVSRGNGSIRLVGRGGLITVDPDPVAFPDTLIRVRVDAAHFSPRLLAVLWNSPLVRLHIERRAKTTAGIHKVNQTDLELTPIPLPPRAEQERLMADVDRCFSVTTDVSVTVGKQKLRCARLRQSILKWAFEGKLADQNSNDEPASVLLERIKAERAAAMRVKKSRRSNEDVRATV